MGGTFSRKSGDVPMVRMLLPMRSQGCRKIIDITAGLKEDAVMKLCVADGEFRVPHVLSAEQRHIYFLINTSPTIISGGLPWALRWGCVDSIHLSVILCIFLFGVRAGWS